MDGLTEIFSFEAVYIVILAFIGYTTIAYKRKTTFYWVVNTIYVLLLIEFVREYIIAPKELLWLEVSSIFLHGFLVFISIIAFLIQHFTAKPTKAEL